MLLGGSLVAGSLVGTCRAADPVPFDALRKSGDEWGAVFCGALGSRDLIVSAKGLLEVGGRRVGRLPLGRSELLEALWTRPLGHDLLMAYESSDRVADGSSGGLCRLSADMTQRRWCTRFPAFNVMAATSGQSTVYLAGIGTLAEVDAASGRYRWMLGGLYDTSSAFNVFRTPIESDLRIVEFYASAGTGGSSIWRAVVDRESRRLLSAGEVAGYPVGAVEFTRTLGACAR